MYESFFGLNEKPFNLTPDPRYFYLSSSHREALAALLYGVHEKAGLVTLTGAVGVGKTMILASFLDQIRENAEAASFSGGVSESRLAFLKDLSGALGISPEQDSPIGLSEAIRTFAVEKNREGRRVVVLVDEAQELSLEELDHFHHLSNLEAPDAKLLQIVLAGTEKLDEQLRDRSLEALWQRVAIRCAIQPLEPDETVEYIFHRMRVAGSSSFDLFTEGALWRIVNHSRGVPRLINLACNQAMIVAYSSGMLPVEEETVRNALKGMEGGHLGIETEGLVTRKEVKRLVQAVSRRVEQGIAHDDFHKEEVILRRRSRRPFFSSFSLRRRRLYKLVFALLLPGLGVLIAMGMLKPHEKESQRVTLVSTEKSAVERVGLSPEETAGTHESPQGDLERTSPEREVVAVRDKDFAGIALERYGRLNVEMLKLLREKNPQIRDWNRLDRTAHLVLPDVPQAADGGTNFYTIQVGAFRAEEGAVRMASELVEKGAQNLFLVRGEEKNLTFVCVGVFESGRHSSGSLGKIKEWGYEDAFPARIEANRLEEILQPYDASIADEPSS